MNYRFFLVILLPALFLFSCRNEDEGKPVRETKRYQKILESLSSDKDHQVKINVSGNPSAPIALLQKLAASDDPLIRASVASNLSASPELLIQLGNDSAYEVKLALVYNPNTPSSILLKLAKDNSTENVSADIARISPLSDDLIRFFNEKPETREWMSSNPTLPQSEIEKLYKDDIGIAGIALNPNTPANILQKLKDSTIEINGIESNPYILSLVANPKIPSEMISEIYEWDGEYTDGMYTVRELIAYNPNTPEDILDSLSSDIYSEGYFGVSCNPSTPYHILKRYFSDDSDWIRENVVKNGNIPSDSLHMLRLNGDVAMRKGIALNPNINQDDLLALAGDSVTAVRAYAARNTKLPIEVLEKLAKDSVPEVRQGVADYKVMHITFYSDEVPYRTNN